MHPCLHSCSSQWAVRHSFRLTCPWPTARPGLRCQRDLRRCASPTTSVLSPARPELRLPGVGDLRNLNIDLGDVPDGRYREVEVIRMSHMSLEDCRVGDFRPSSPSRLFYCVMTPSRLCHMSAEGEWTILTLIRTKWMPTACLWCTMRKELPASGRANLVRI